ncbi:MAG: hypothetical protein GY854_22525 [Deltaproteobacteria bacterium]|nr:hypothetical protein [Deltaproteobacteria bacterium]
MYEIEAEAIAQLQRQTRILEQELSELKRKSKRSVKHPLRWIVIGVLSTSLIGFMTIGDPDPRDVLVCADGDLSIGVPLHGELSSVSFPPT